MNSVLISELPRFIDAVWLTIQLTFISSIIGLLLAIPLSLCAISKNSFLRYPVSAFSYFFRGTPLLVQIYLIYFGTAQFPEIRNIPWLWAVLREAYWCALIAFTLNTCAYTIEILKGAIKNTARGEIEAGIALGMSRVTLFRRVIFPSGFRRALPAYSNEIIFMLHGTAQASVIALADILGVARNIAQTTFTIFPPYLIAATLYLALTFFLVIIFKLCERRWLSYLQPNKSG